MFDLFSVIDQAESRLVKLVKELSIIDQSKTEFEYLTGMNWAFK